MPELVAGGPDIPPNLMNELDDENVVFFCGAGISMGAESDLPSFKGLVSQVYQDCRIEASEAEERARKDKEFDRVLDLLERRLVPDQVRSSVIQRLSVEPRGPLVLHQALVELSRTTKGVRLVTTNFDNRFSEALGEGQLIVDAAPRLPVPKPHKPVNSRASPWSPSP